MRKIYEIFGDLFDMSKEEQTNGGNYRPYTQWCIAGGTVYRRDFMSFHGDLEPMPDWEISSMSNLITLWNSTDTAHKVIL